MPGLVEAHFHATYFNIAALEDLDIKYPVEYVSLLSSVNTRLALECGYTAARIWRLPFQCRCLAEKSHRGGPHPRPTTFRKRSRNLFRRGPHGLESGIPSDWHGRSRFHHQRRRRWRKAVRALVKDGVEWVKTYPTGDAAAPDVNDHHTLCMTFEEMHAVVKPRTTTNSRLPVTVERPKG